MRPSSPVSENKPVPKVATTTRSRSLSDESNRSLTLKSPRTARFAEATAVYSPVSPTRATANPFADPPTNHYLPQPQVADVGFGYLNQSNKAGHVSVEMEETDRRYLPPPTPKTPLKSALKSPGAPPRTLEGVLSPTFREEQVLEKTEKVTEKEQKRDLKAKIRVRWAKLVLRGVNFSCSLIILSMISATFTIFNATKALPPRNGLPAWAPNTPIWPQVLLLTIACISLLMAVAIFYAYWRGGHRRAEKVAVYYTTFAIFFFVFSIIVWAIAATVLSQSKKKNNGKDLWGWSCKDNKRKELFKDTVSYDLICRLQDWALICIIIEIIVEVIAITIYGIVFYRYYSKRRLRKSMAARDKARSDMYLAQLKSQSAPNTPGLPNGMLSPRDGGWAPPQGFEAYNKARAMEEGGADGLNEKSVPLDSDSDNSSSSPVQFASRTPTSATPKPFALQPPPIKIHSATPKLTSTTGGFPHRELSVSPPASPPPGYPPVSPVAETMRDHVPAAPGETQYAQVQVPGAYVPPTLGSPGLVTGANGSGAVVGGFDFGVRR